MEPTFYDESRYHHRGNDGPRSGGTKRPMTLDLNAVKSSKKPRGNSLLTSPDLIKLNLESPELEKLIIQQHGGMAPSQCMYPKTVTAAADDNGGNRGDPFLPDALGGLGNNSPAGYNLYHHQQQPPVDIGSIMPPSTTMSMVDVSWHTNGYHQQQQPTLSGNCNPMVSSTIGGGGTTSYGGYYALQDPAVSIKEEPQTVPCASPPDNPPRSPIDMEDQERMKLERKRLRNRIAASKCRRRKLEKIARLEDRVAHLKNENSDLLIKVTFLKDQVCHLKQQVMEHVRSGCDISTNSVYPSYDEL